MYQVPIVFLIRYLLSPTSIWYLPRRAKGHTFSHRWLLCHVHYTLTRSQDQLATGFLGLITPDSFFLNVLFTRPL